MSFVTFKFSFIVFSLLLTGWLCLNSTLTSSIIKCVMVHFSQVLLNFTLLCNLFSFQFPNMVRSTIRLANQISFLCYHGYYRLISIVKSLKECYEYGFADALVSGWNWIVRTPILKTTLLYIYGQLAASGAVNSSDYVWFNCCMQPMPSLSLQCSLQVPLTEVSSISTGLIPRVSSWSGLGNLQMT